ncbi:MAG: acetyl-CoA hydrolase/transferase C-terminal domain-containing protein [Minicystis sp.]
MASRAPLPPGRVVSLEEALAIIEPGDEVFVHSACAEPRTLIEGLCAEARRGSARLRGVTLLALTYRGPGEPPPYADTALLAESGLRLKTFFPIPALKEAFAANLVDYVPASFAAIPGLLRAGLLRPAAALLQVSLPDHLGRCSFGPSAALVPAILELGIPIIAEMNRRCPFVGGVLAPMERFAAIVESDRDLVEAPPAPVGPLERRIAENVAELVPDGATVQLGVGAISEAVFQCLAARRDLGLAGSAVLEGAVDLIRSGAVTNLHKPIDQGKTVGSLLLGGRRLFDFAHENPSLELAGIDHCNSPINVARYPRFTSINSALEVDYWGQVNAESLGATPFAGAGSQVDYAVGAWHGPESKAIIALPSATPSGRPRIVPRLNGVPVTNPRQLAQFVVTEKGIADLRGRSLGERERLLRAIA